eukprot:CAMPEP_0185836984 /NCGR_PEP_ID=MMETSP1353-20130828/10611_1 /TAXON_ID=1077150 /ORGANISM="Erythrolobus australicus, Strain CCMP3124" /LENGTH=175 /DNA_ID=CAMNT_0028535831 /DNA_START=164 /DNA_END=688 /DNA_ORIENTATION=-
MTRRNQDLRPRPVLLILSVRKCARSTVILPSGSSVCSSQRRSCRRSSWCNMASSESSAASAESLFASTSGSEAAEPAPARPCSDPLSSIERRMEASGLRRVCNDVVENCDNEEKREESAASPTTPLARAAHPGTGSSSTAAGGPSPRSSFPAAAPPFPRPTNFSASAAQRALAHA